MRRRKKDPEEDPEKSPDPFFLRCLDLMRRGFRAMLDNPTSDGSTYHELANLIYPDCWEEAILDTFQQWQAAHKASSVLEP